MAKPQQAMQPATPHAAVRYATAEDAQAAGRCGAKLRRDRGYCSGYPVRGGRRCRMHGGIGLPGASNPNFTHGRRSQHMLSAPKLRQHYEDGLKAGLDLLDLKEDLATFEGFIALALERIGTGDSTAVWKALKKAKQERNAAERAFAVAARQQDAEGSARAQAKINEQLDEIDRLIDQGFGIVSAVADVRDLTGDRVRLVESQRRGMVEAQQYVAVQQVQALLALVEDVIRRNVADPTSLAGISRDLAQVATQLPG